MENKEVDGGNGSGNDKNSSEPIKDETYQPSEVTNKPEDTSRDHEAGVLWGLPSWNIEEIPQPSALPMLPTPPVPSAPPALSVPLAPSVPPVPPALPALPALSTQVMLPNLFGAQQQVLAPAIFKGAPARLGSSSQPTGASPSVSNPSKPNINPSPTKKQLHPVPKHQVTPVKGFN